ncbi:MAG: hypothetical protein R3E79_42225 [Caldilineaceae bacterium]
MLESDGLQLPTEVTDTIGVRYYCPKSSFIISPPTGISTDAKTVDWNCKDSLAESLPISANITGNYDNGISIWDENIEVETEWDKLVFTGGFLNRQRNLLDSKIVTMPRVTRFYSSTRRFMLMRLLDIQSEIEDQHVLDELSAEEDWR